MRKGVKPPTGVRVCNAAGEEMPPLSRVPFGGADNVLARGLPDLRAAVIEDCESICVWHFGVVPFLYVVDSVRGDAAYRDAQAKRAKAKPLFKAVLRAAESLRNLGEQSLVLDEAVEAARGIERITRNYLSGDDIPPGRLDWLRVVHARQPIAEIPDEVLTAMALLAGWWPEPITEAHLCAKAVSPAHVFGRERKTIHKARADLEKMRQILDADPTIQALAAVLIQPPPYKTPR